MIIQKLGEKFLFHSNLDVNPKQINHFSQYCQEIFRKWSRNLSVSSYIPSTITSQVIWFNKHIKIDIKSLCNNSLADQGINHVGQLFKENGMTKAWLDIKTRFSLSNKQHYFWIQLINAIPKSWKEELRRSNRISDALSVYDHHLIKSNQIYSLNKCNSKELYCLQISLNNSKTRSQLYFEELFQNKDIDWKHVYHLPRRVTVDTNLRIFQYKILNKVVYLNEKLFSFKKISYPLCSFCQSENETPIHLFHGCIKTNLLWYKLKEFLKTKIDLPVNTPQGAIFGFLNCENNSDIINHLLLIFKYYLFNSREHIDFRKMRKFRKKWEIIGYLLQ